MLQAHELSDVFHGGRVQVLASGQEIKTMLLAVGTEVPFLDFFFRRIWLNALGESSCVTYTFLETAKVVVR